MLKNICLGFVLLCICMVSGWLHLYSETGMNYMKH